MTTKTYHVNLLQLISNVISILQFEELSQQGWIKEDKVPVLDNKWYVSLLLLQECNKSSGLTAKNNLETNGEP